MQCPHCEHNIPNGATHCPDCGKPLADPGGIRTRNQSGGVNINGGKVHGDVVGRDQTHVSQTAIGNNNVNVNGDNNQILINPSPSRPFFVPFPHNPDFVGRDDDLRRLHAMLQTGNAVGIRPVLVGIGKTQLAVEYAHAHRADYPDGIFWLNAVNPLLEEFAALAEALGQAERETPRDQATQRAWAYLDQHRAALVLFDNVNDPADLSRPVAYGLIPANLPCRTLLTTRRRDFPRTFQPFEVNVLPPAAARQLLLRARPDLLAAHPAAHDAADEICKQLGYLPLAIELAAAYLGEYPDITLDDYQWRMRAEGALETVDDPEAAHDLPTRHAAAVRATLQTAWAGLTDEAARTALLAAAQLPEAELIPMARLGLLSGLGVEAAPGHPAPVVRALKRLHTASLVEELQAEQVRLHPLVREFAARLSPPAFRIEMAARLAGTLGAMAALDAAVGNRGVDAVIADLRVALTLCDGAAGGAVREQLARLERVLDREAHHLRGWDRGRDPAFFLQQFRQRALNLGNFELAARAGAQLAAWKLPYLAERFPVSRESEALVRTLEGHTAPVHGVAVTEDGRFAVSAAGFLAEGDYTLKVWDLASGACLRTLAGHTAPVHGVAVTEDGRFAVSAAGSSYESTDNTLKVWDLTSGICLRMLEGHTRNVNGVAVTEDGRLAVSASRDNTLKVWDLTSGACLRTMEGHTGPVTGVAVTGDGRFAVSASLDGALKVWNLTSGACLLTLVEDAWFYACVLTPDERAIVAGDGAGAVHFFELVRPGEEGAAAQRHEEGRDGSRDL
ncbi:MAG: hypothetical protein WCF84_25155 [Anaerolineae bacterium]